MPRPNDLLCSLAEWQHRARQRSGPESNPAIAGQPWDKDPQGYGEDLHREQITEELELSHSNQSHGRVVEGRERCLSFHKIHAIFCGGDAAKREESTGVRVGIEACI